MNSELRHPQAPAPLLSAGQGSDLYGKGADILLIPYIEAVPGESNAAVLTVGVLDAGCAKTNRAVFRRAGQIPGGIGDNGRKRGVRSETWFPGQTPSMKRIRKPGR